MRDDLCEACGKRTANRECAHGILCDECDEQVHGAVKGECMTTFEVRGMDKAQEETLRALRRDKIFSFMHTEHLDNNTVNVVVENHEADRLTDWLESRSLEYRLV